MLQIYYDGPDTGPAGFGIKKLEESCRRLEEDVRVRAVLSEAVPDQGYDRRVEDGCIYIKCGGESGVMYSLLDLAGELARSGAGLSCMQECSREPYIKKRGIKFNIPLDARTPSYSDASDSAFENIAQVWEKEFWMEFLDEMALHKWNVLSLWSLSPFPSLVKVPEYPLACLSDVKASVIPPKAEMSGAGMYAPDMEEGLYTIKRMGIEEKTDFFRWVMEYAKSRCVEVWLFTWNLFVYGTEQAPYPITCDQSNPVTRDYIYRAVGACLAQYPLLAGIGVTSGENMKGDDTDIPFLRNTYARAVEEWNREHPERKAGFIHRMQYARFHEIKECYRNYEGDFAFSFKYSQAHMYSSPRPVFFDRFVEQTPEAGEEAVKFWMTLRDDDFYLFRWGSPSYAGAYLENLPVRRMAGFYMGADGYTWGRDYSLIQDEKHILYMQKMWYKFMIWGELSYNIKLEADYFREELSLRYGRPGRELYGLWESVSGIIPLVNSVHWHDYDFQWWPEGCCRFLHPPVGKLVFADIREFMSCPSMPGSGWLSVKEYSALIKEGKLPFPDFSRDFGTEEKTPLEAAGRLRLIASEALVKIEALKEAGEQQERLGGDYEALLMDLECLCFLGSYYSWKLKAAAALCLSYMGIRKEECRNISVECLIKACSAWKRYSNAAHSVYKPQRLSRLCSRVDLRAFDRAAELDIRLAQEERL